jgi:hypothetical protein
VLRSLTFVFCVLGVLAVACGGGSGPGLYWTSYDRSCVGNSDCVPIAVAAGCVCPLCNNRGINLMDQVQYQKDAMAYQAACAGTPCTKIACAVVTAYCDGNGTCQVH